MPRKHYDGPPTAPAALSTLSEEAQVVYAVLLAEVNRLRQEAGLPARTRDDLAQTRTQVAHRLQAVRKEES